MRFPQFLPRKVIKKIPDCVGFTWAVSLYWLYSIHTFIIEIFLEISWWPMGLYRRIVGQIIFQVHSLVTSLRPWLFNILVFHAILLQGSAKEVKKRLDMGEIVQAHENSMQDKNTLFAIVQASIPSDAGPSGISNKEEDFEKIARESLYEQDLQVKTDITKLIQGVFDIVCVYIEFCLCLMPDDLWGKELKIWHFYICNLHLYTPATVWSPCSETPNWGSFHSWNNLPCRNW